QPAQLPLQVPPDRPRAGELAFQDPVMHRPGALNDELRVMTRRVGGLHDRAQLLDLLRSLRLGDGREVRGDRHARHHASGRRGRWPGPPGTLARAADTGQGRRDAGPSDAYRDGTFRSAALAPASVKAAAIMSAARPAALRASDTSTSTKSGSRPE